MAGLALTDNFLLSTATVMLGNQSELNDLNPADHSIGLVKNFTISSEPSYTELMQGVKGDIVWSEMTANPVRASMEVFEYTAANLAYATGQDGGSFTTQTVNTTVSTGVPASPAQNTLVVASAAGITTGKTILIDKNGNDDFVIRKVTNVSTNTLTLDADLPAIASGTKVYVVNPIDLGSKTNQPFFAAKIAGKLVNGERVVALLPKIRITKGFNLAFITNDYGNLPFEFSVYDLVATDPAYAQFGSGNAKGRIYRA